ncbi:MAG: NUDIX domain-containing protein [Candidatus Moranbacteria bacterium]|nr:NUDIX domain-containing protein [Candidatus Moranbacteria bacterium]
MKNPWKKINQRYVYQHSTILKVRKDLVVKPDGEKGKYSVIERPDTVAIVAKDKDDYVYMIKQWRYPVGREFLEVPLGLVEQKENPKTAAKRELKEETGVLAKEIIKIGETFGSPGLMTNKTHIFATFNFEVGEQNLDPTEKIKVEKIKYAKIKEMIKNGEINNSPTLVSLYFLDIFDNNK